MKPTISARHTERTRRASFRDRFGELFKSLGIPLILLVLGVVLGLAADGLRDRSAADRATKEIRNKTLVASANAFSGYMVNWSRLRTVAEAEAEIYSQLAAARARAKVEKGAPATDVAGLEARLATVGARKEKYIVGRDASKDELLRQLETAKIFFGDALLSKIEAFEQFDRSTSVLGLRELPLLDAWRKEFGPILKMMQEEVRRDES